MDNEIVINTNSRVLIVDASYYIFYRYFSSLRWYSFQNNEKIIDYANLHNNKIFVDAYKNHIAKDIEKWKKRWFWKKYLANRRIV